MRKLREVVEHKRKTWQMRDEKLDSLENEIRNLEHKQVLGPDEKLKLEQLKAELRQEKEIELFAGKFIYLPSQTGIREHRNDFPHYDSRLHESQIPLLVDELISNGGQTYSEIRYGRFYYFDISTVDGALNIAGARGKTRKYLWSQRFVENRNYRQILDIVEAKLGVRNLNDEIKEQIKYPFRNSAVSEISDKKDGVNLTFSFPNILPGAIIYLFENRGHIFVYKEGTRSRKVDWEEVEDLAIFAWNKYIKSK